MNSIPFRARADLFSKPGPGKPSNSGADRRRIRASGDSMSITESPVIRVCRLLNEAGARYLIIGGQACILHGLVRTTEDVDVLVEATENNCRRVLDALIASKETYREQDVADRLRLLELKRRGY